MPERCRWLLYCSVALVLLQLPSPSIAFLRYCCCRSASLAREGAIGCTNVAAAEETDGRCESPRSSRSNLKEMELWLDEVGVDRRGGGCGPPAARLTSVSGKGIGLTAAVELERDSTVRESNNLVQAVPAGVCLANFKTHLVDEPLLHSNFCLHIHFRELTGTSSSLPLQPRWPASPEEYVSRRTPRMRLLEPSERGRMTCLPPFRLPLLQHAQRNI